MGEFMTTRKKIVLILGIMLSMIIALVVSVVGFQPKVSNNTSSEGTGSTPNNNVSTNVDTNLDAKVEKPATYTYQPGEIEVQKGGSTLNFTYTPSVNAMEGEEDATGSEEEGEDTTTTPITKAYEYIFGNVMDETIAINLNYIDATGVNISYAWSDTRLDTSTSITTYTSFTTQTIQANGTDKYIYIIVSPTDTTIPTTFTKNIWWNYGKVGKVSIVNNAGATDVEQEIVKGQYIYEEDLKTPTAPNGYYFDAWFMDSNYTQLATFPIQSQGQSLYARFANLPSDYLAWDSETSSYYVKQMDANGDILGYNNTTSLYNNPIPNLLIPAIYNDGTNGEAQVTIIGGSGSDPDYETYSCFYGCATVSLPCTIITINSYAFAHCNDIDLSKCTNLITIGSSAFYGCNSTNITIPSSVTTIGANAFEMCTSLTNIMLPNSLTTISQSLFYCCENLRSVTIPSSLITIGDSAFSSTGLISIDLSKCTSLTSIDRWAFESCDGLTSITIPSSLTTIGNAAFKSCDSLTSVYISDIVAWCNITFGTNTANPLYLAKNLYLNNELVTNLNIPNTVTEIKPYAFMNCTSLTSVTLPISLTTIGDSAFSGCSALDRVSLGDCNNLTTIGGNAFTNCSSLTSITLPSSLTTIGNSAFSGCSALTSVVIPSNVTKIGQYAFKNCTNLGSLTFAVDGTWYSGTKTQQTNMDGGTSYTIVADTDYSSTFKSSTYYWYKK